MKHTLSLKAVSDHPFVVWYDGDCGICQAFVTQQTRRARAQRAEISVVFQPSYMMTDELAATLGLTQSDLQSGLVVVGHENAWRHGAEAVNAVVFRLWRPSRFWIRVLERVLPFLWLEKMVYAVVAKNRRKISLALGLSACKIPEKK